jgi:2-amino-4-hydroxy-6-hydroxymethyldihydropteridine diphosphokinase
MLEELMVSTAVIIALGSNLGSPSENVSMAIKRLGAILLPPTRHSTFWQSEPVKMEDDAASFVNAVILGQTSMAPVELLNALKEIEETMGRDHSLRDHSLRGHSLRDRRDLYQSRTIDLDIIAYGNEIIDLASLVIPHPRAMDRLFVLLPLAQIYPEFCFPGQGLSLNSLIDKAPKIEISDLGL